MTLPTKVEFHGNELFGVTLGGVTLIAVKPIVSAMKLSWQGQLERIKRHRILSEGIRKLRMPLGKGGPQDTVCLPLNLIPGWLFTIKSGQIRDQDLRAKVELFQRECFDVLSKHFAGGRPVHSAAHMRRCIETVREARLLFGRRAGAQVWRELGMPYVPEMAETFRQLELFQGNENAA